MREHVVGVTHKALNVAKYGHVPDVGKHGAQKLGEPQVNIALLVRELPIHVVQHGRDKRHESRNGLTVKGKR